MFDQRHAVMLLFYTSNGHLCWPTSTVIFFDQHRWKIFICQDGLNFSLPNKWEHASFGRNKMSVELAQKNQADLHCKLFMQHQHTKTSSAVKKNIIGQRAFLKKNYAMSAEKCQSGILHDRCRLWSFLFNPFLPLCTLLPPPISGA